MEPLNETLRLIKRRAELENAMRQPGGIRITEERELLQLRDALAQFADAATSLLATGSRMRTPLEGLSGAPPTRLLSSH
jgi:hypothetical protein